MGLSKASELFPVRRTPISVRLAASKPFFRSQMLAPPQPCCPKPRRNCAQNMASTYSSNLYSVLARYSVIQ